METATIPRLRLRVTAAAETIIRSGHPWLFADSIRHQNRDGQLDDLAVIFDRNDKFLAIGLFDPESPIRVRVLHTGKPMMIDATWWQERLRQTLARREGLFDAQTNGYRCIHGESDGWPGLVLDRYDTTFVLKLYTAAWLPRLDEVVDNIRATLHPQRLVLRLSRNIQPLATEQFHRDDGQLLLGEKPEGPVTFLESGLRFEADVLQGQKTGFFLDQRENRRCVESLARGRDVLNAFSFSGGFSLYAARGGAKAVTDLDISEHALAGAQRNFALNQAVPGVAACRHDWVRADAFDWLAAKPVRKFGLIVLDPPSLAKREAERERAIGAYRQLNADGLRWLAPGGVLVAASCSAHVSIEEFFGAVRQAARETARPFTEWQTTAHAPDHPATFPEARYLKAIYLRFT
ncbi:MAG: class I SAM-dependent methyltransferase [Verrucomicrobia bacterium]|nr:class I SAM-dependent methyltransferase [Verrucomicrobiota bacterium]